ncbi:50S ribosomal protein L11 [Candidatus Saccharibacteria bacterium]|nr:50S ribosomal protein L11 [Candidatus Saccharibacteria bacterium]MCB9834886.1 50S ribosomal protein L11 [Candidatus Nomurabacteria bacterium]
MASKKVIANLKMVIPGGGATPAPPVGSSLGQYGVNMMEFIQAFNDATSSHKGQQLPVKIKIFEDKSFSFSYSLTPADQMILSELGIKKGSGEPNKNKVASLTDLQLTKIAEAKMSDLNANDLEAAKKIIAGTARSMGIEIKG